jgi:membrane-associated protease RseP (regulator of RpoE activity)
MKATQFFIGFGPRLWSFHRGETEYGVRLLPLGAFVRIIGMNNLDEVPPADEARTYRQKSYPRRMLVITAGSLMHLLVAIALLFGVFALRGELVDRAGAEVGGVAADTGAAAADIRRGDIILSVGGAAVEDGDLGAAVRQSQPGDTVEVVVERDGEQFTVDATLTENTTPGEFNGTALLGVTSRGAMEWEELSVGEAAQTTFTDLFPATWESTKGIVQVLNPINIFEHLTGESDDPATRPTTLVGVTQFSDDVGEMQGFAGMMYLLAILNVFVGVFNMFPLLPLDGGHAAIATYERVREIGRGGRRYFTDVARLMPFTMGVIVILLFLFMSGLYLDITEPL